MESSAPWRLVYQYEGQPEHREAYRTEGDALYAERRLREYAERADKRVTTRVEHRDARP